MILEQFEDRLVQILLAVAVLSGVLSAFEDDPHVSGENIMFLTHCRTYCVSGLFIGDSLDDVVLFFDGS